MDPKEYPRPREGENTQWGRLAALMATVGGALMWSVTNWDQVRPVIYSPVSAMLAMMTLYGLGGLSIYWVVTRPLEDRLKKAEKLISELRGVERSLLKDDADKASRIAALETSVKFMTDQIHELKRQIEIMQAAPMKPVRPRAKKSE